MISIYELGGSALIFALWVVGVALICVPTWFCRSDGLAAKRLIIYGRFGLLLIMFAASTTLLVF